MDDLADDYRRAAGVPAGADDLEVAVRADERGFTRLHFVNAAVRYRRLGLGEPQSLRELYELLVCSP